MSEPMCEVSLLGYPLGIAQQAEEHHNELMREFALIALGEQQQHDLSVPARLLDLVKKLTAEYGGANAEVERQRQAAVAAGAESVDLTQHVPPAVAEATRALGAMLDEADEFCRAGGALLTLATPPEAKLFRTWYLDEFASQIAGAAPTSWPAYAQQAAQSRS